MAAFPLLQLPLVAMEHVLCIMDPYELIKVTGEFILTDNWHGLNFQPKLPESLDLLRIQNADFIKYDQFIKLDCKQIVLFRAPFTSQEIHRFLKSWKACESHLNLKAFKIFLEKSNSMNMVKELAREEVKIDGDLLNEFARRKFFYDESNGFNIVRSDGKVGTVCIKGWDGHDSQLYFSLIDFPFVYWNTTV
uniref:FBA_2 domain-containing protein n=1 Tax=Caenorhabditis tropicalis TaxID=1561998 RepID=A0A1I7TUJ5_9PELO